MTQAVWNADFHNHIIPGVDDGASNDEETTEALAAFVAQDITAIITTTHIDGSVTTRPRPLAERLREIDTGWARLERIRAQTFPNVRILRGAEIMLDTPEPDLSDARLRLGGYPFALVEYPFMRVPPNSQAVLRRIVEAGITPIVAHPERYHGIDEESPLPYEWKQCGALLQVNAGSLVGKYGTTARDNAFAVLEHGLADYICSDFHSRGEPATNAARELLAEFDATELADMLAGTNPRRLFAGQGPLPVPALTGQRSLVSMVRRWFSERVRK